jgi:hypothetical protein
MASQMSSQVQEAPGRLKGHFKSGHGKVPGT